MTLSLALLAILFGFILLIWSANHFIDGCAFMARHFGVSPLLIGVVIIGLGTSMPELAVSLSATLKKSSGIALGNAYGSNIANIGLILGLIALIQPITIHSRILRQELPILLGITVLAVWQLFDGEISRFDAFSLLGIFILTMAWIIKNGFQNKDHDNDTLTKEIKDTLPNQTLRFPQALFWMIVGLILLLFASNILVWGAVEIAHYLGVSDLIVGLTVVAVGTALPELASSLLAIRKNEHDLALGNLLGSNLFNTLAVVGVSASIYPIPIAPEILYRDMPVMVTLTALLFIFCYGLGRINRLLGLIFLACFIGYTSYLVFIVVSG